MPQKKEVVLFLRPNTKTEFVARQINRGFFKQLLTMLGAMLFFYHLEICERTYRTIREGKAWRTRPEYFLDADIINLLFRSTHPAPLSRGINAMEILISNPQMFGDISEEAVKNIVAAGNCAHDLFVLMTKTSEPVLDYACETHSLVTINHLSFLDLLDDDYNLGSGCGYEDCLYNLSKESR